MRNPPKRTTCCLAALTRSRAVWWGSLLLGLSGIPLFVLAFLG